MMKNKTEFSKTILTIQYVASALLILATVAGMLLNCDVTAIAALAGASILITGYDTKHYYWKARNENRAKYAQMFVKAFAQEYGVDAAIQLAETVLKE
jgi:hypothetical protein